MRLLAFSDLHRDIEAAQRIVVASADADVIVGAGDFATRGIGAWDTLEVLKACQAPVVLVHGNHDDPNEIRALCDGHDGFHYLHASSVTVAGQVFFGLGGEVPSRSDTPWNATETESDAAEILRSCPDAAILVTHTPPHGIADLQINGEHEGSSAIRDAAIRCQPKLLLCGHIHQAWGTQGTLGRTRVHNLGPTAIWITL